MCVGDAEMERNLIQLDESVEAVEYLAEPLQVSVSAVSVPLAEKVGASVKQAFLLRLLV